MTLNYQKNCQPLFQRLSSRQKEIIFRRFGLENGKRETLEAIGKDLGLTRERVRQIIEATLAKMRKGEITPEIVRAFLTFKKYLSDNGGLKREDLLFSEPIFNHQGNSSNWVNFLLVLEGNFCCFSETKDNYSFWAFNPKIFPLAAKLLAEIEKKLLKEKKPLNIKELLSVSKKNNSQFLKSTLEVSKRVLKTADAKYGLKSWPEVNPRGVGDLTLLIFRKVKKPLHFIEVANLIDEFLLKRQSLQEFSAVFASSQMQKKTNYQTVHNQLIKDSQFVLVGRGLYALREWGYNPGTVKDVISRVLKEAKQPLSEDEVLKRVLSQRLVKESTILLNLGNKKCFLKLDNNRYSLREA
jgi:hypothetical protein